MEKVGPSPSFSYVCICFHGSHVVCCVWRFSGLVPLYLCVCSSFSSSSSSPSSSFFRQLGREGGRKERRKERMMKSEEWMSDGKNEMKWMKSVVFSPVKWFFPSLLFFYLYLFPLPQLNQESRLTDQTVLWRLDTRKGQERRTENPLHNVYLSFSSLVWRLLGNNHHNNLPLRLDSFSSFLPCLFSFIHLLSFFLQF